MGTLEGIEKAADKGDLVLNGDLSLDGMTLSLAEKNESFEVISWKLLPGVFLGIR